MLSGAVHLICLAMTWLTFASTTALQGLTVILPALAGAGLLIFLSQLFPRADPERALPWDPIRMVMLACRSR